MEIYSKPAAALESVLNMKLMKDVGVHLEDKKESRIFFAFIWVMYSLVYTTKMCFSASLVFIKQEGILSLTEVSVILALFYTVYAPLQVVGGMVADKYSPERMITVGLVGSAVANAVIFFNQSYLVMLVTWTFNAVIQFALWPSVFKILSSQLVRSDRPKMVFYISFSGSFGSVVASLVAAVIGENWRYNFAISAVILAFFAIALQFFCHHLDPILKKDRADSESIPTKQTAAENSMSTGKLFLISGFFPIVAAVFFRTIVENGSKSFAATMLVDMYPSSVSGEIGSILNVVVLIGGIMGTVLVKKVLYPRIIKNEIVGYFIMLLLALPFSAILCRIGDERLPVWVVVVSLTASVLLLNATHLLTSYYNMNFVRFGKNGTASGIINAAASAAIAVQYIVFAPVAETLGWRTVAAIWMGIVILTAICILLALRPVKRFKKEYN